MSPPYPNPPNESGPGVSPRPPMSFSFNLEYKRELRKRKLSFLEAVEQNGMERGIIGCTEGFNRASPADDRALMRGPWCQSLLDRLVSAKNDGGGWSYSPDGPSAAEPTAWMTVALSAYDADTDLIAGGLDCLTRMQQSDGGIPGIPTIASTGWATGLAILAWTLAGGGLSRSYDDPARRAADWLLRHSGQPAPRNPAIYGHDTSLIGWSWVEGTHSWVEPTSYALLALDAVGLRDHPRAVEGRRLLRDRVIPGGGWNYGNARMFGAALRPFPETTGVALLALADTTRDEVIESSLDYLLDELPKVRSPMSTAWGVMALTAWNRRSPHADAWLAETAARFQQEPCRPLLDALLLLAAMYACPLVNLAQPSEVRSG